MNMCKPFWVMLRAVVAVTACAGALSMFARHTGTRDAALALQAIVWITAVFFILAFAMRSLRTATEALLLGITVGGLTVAAIAVAIALGVADTIPMPAMDPATGNASLVGAMTAVGGVLPIIATKS